MELNKEEKIELLKKMIDDYKQQYLELEIVIAYNEGMKLTNPSKIDGINEANNQASAQKDKIEKMINVAETKLKSCEK